MINVVQVGRQVPIRHNCTATVYLAISKHGFKDQTVYHLKIKLIQSLHTANYVPLVSVWNIFSPLSFFCQSKASYKQDCQHYDDLKKIKFRFANILWLAHGRYKYKCKLDILNVNSNLYYFNNLVRLVIFTVSISIAVSRCINIQSLCRNGLASMQTALVAITFV